MLSDLASSECAAYRPACFGSPFELWLIENEHETQIIFQYVGTKDQLQASISNHEFAGDVEPEDIRISRRAIQ